MTFLHFALFFLTPATILSESTQAAPSYSQTYRIFIRGVPVGTESVSEITDKNGNLISSGRHEIFVTDGLETRRMSYETETVRARRTLAPMHYSCRYTSGASHDSYEVTVEKGRIHRVLKRGGRSSEVTVALQPGMLILDFSVYQHYDYVAGRYDFKKGGRQSIANFSPVTGADVPIVLTFLKDSDLETPKGSLPVRNFRVDFIGISGGTLSVDKSGRLVRLVVPQQDLEVLRSDLAPQ
jgi:hypothetical protein